jgi:hypothetical protein
MKIDMKQQFPEDDNYYFNQEKELRGSLPKFKDKELLEIFQGAKEIIPIKIKEYKSAIREKESEIQSELRKIYLLKTDSFSEWFGEEMIRQFMMPDLVAMERNFFRLKRLEYLLNPKREMDSWYKLEEKIEIARRYPIEELARSKLDLRKAGRNSVSLCPLHNEKTPSFYLYPETNRFFCFGCQEKGDVINLAIALYGLDFKEAVGMLQHY